MTVGLSDVSTRLGLGGEQEAEKYIRDMVCYQSQELYPAKNGNFSVCDGAENIVYGCRCMS